jgi:hypothetical protein
MSDATTEQATKPTHDLMGYEGQIGQTDATAPETELPNAPEDVQSLINKTVKEVTVDEKTGKYIYPENIDPVLKAAVAATKSYRDNQSGYTKSQQSLKESEAEVEALREKLATHTSKSLELTRADRQELDNLKNTDPDAWRVKLNNLEQDSKKAIQDELTEATEEARTKASGEFELARRYTYLDEFNIGRDVIITPELLDTEIPPRITKRLADGEVTFEEFIDDVDEYLSKGKKVSQPGNTETTDLNKANGSSTAPKGDDKLNEGIEYASMTF